MFFVIYYILYPLNVADNVCKIIRYLVPFIISTVQALSKF